MDPRQYNGDIDYFTFFNESVLADMDANDTAYNRVSAKWWVCTTDVDWC
jgi:hypothetical protein